MKKADKERVVAELTERLRTTETLLVADYRGLTMPQIDELRSKLIEHGARFAVVKNTLTRRAAEAGDAVVITRHGKAVVALEGWLRRQSIDDRESSERPLGHRDRDRAIQLHDG